MSNSPVPPGASGPLANLLRAIQDLATAADTATLRRVLAKYPGLSHPNLDSFLTRRLQEAWGRGDKAGASIFLACRAFLARCRSRGVEAILAEPLALPLPRNSPFGQLLLSTNKRAYLPRRAELARRALPDVRRASEPDLWATLQREVADCLAKSEGPDRAERLEEALDSYRAALEVWDNPPHAGSLKWAETLHAMAAAFRRRVEGERVDNFQHARQLYEKALTVRTREDHPLEWAETQHDLGGLWLEMPGGDSLENTLQGIRCYKAALTVRTRQKMPDLWAETMHDLAIAYSEHPGGDRARNLEKAIELCLAVQEVLCPETDPLGWGRSQVALGNAYVVRLKGNRMENLEEAIQNYRAALNTLTRQAYPADWARTQYDLATAYWYYPVDRADNLASAFEHFQKALKVYTPEAYPMEWADVQTGLGNVYCQPEVGQRARRLEQAIACYQAALTIRTRDNDPPGWATLQNNLGNAYADRLLGDRAENQEQAIACYELALLERTRQEAPARWAETMNNLGTVYIERLRGDPAENQEKAVRCLRQALEVHTPLVFPNDSRRAARNLAHLLFAQKRWKPAAHYYAVAIEATERLYQAAVTEPGRQAELAESQNLFTNRAYALAHRGRFEEAIECLESGRARALSERLDLQRFALETLSPRERERMQGIVDRIRALQAELREDGPRAFPAIAADLEAAYSQLPDLGEKIRFLTIGQTATPDRPLVYLVATSHGSLALLVPAGVKRLTEREVVWLDHFTSLHLRRFLLEPGGEEQPGSYLNGTGIEKRGSVKGRPAILAAALQRILPELGQRLMAPLAERLRDVKVRRITLIPGGLLALFPLHAAYYPAPRQDPERPATCSDGQRYFLDDFDVTYAPAARVLRAKSQALAETRAAQPSLFAVGNPQPQPPAYPPLPFARMEVEEIAHLFRTDTHHSLHETEATYPAVEAGLRRQPPSPYFHFACHGEFNPLDPLASGLSLAWQGQRPADPPTLLTLKDLLGRFTLTGVRLVVLSACQTAITEMERLPDEAIGLPAGFLQAGAAAVIGSLWPVNDVSTALLIGRFYLYHLKGDPDRPQDGPLPPAQALRRAQQWLRDVTADELVARYQAEKREPKHLSYAQAVALWLHFRRQDPDSHPFAHPQFWAPFTISGQPG